MEASIFAMIIAGRCLFHSCLLMIALAFLGNTHFKNWVWNSILDGQTILMACKMAVINIWTSGWCL
jgi:hypothetical protein